MTESLHMCAIGGCDKRIPSSDPICKKHREDLSLTSLLPQIDMAYADREKGVPKAALKFAEMVSKATLFIRDGKVTK